MKVLPKVFFGRDLFQPDKVVRKTRLSSAIDLVRDSQQKGEITAWVISTESSFYPPDIAAAGIDLDALAVIRIPPDPGILQKVVKHLERSNAFGLIIRDLR